MDALLKNASYEEWEAVEAALASGFDPRVPSSEYGYTLLHFTCNHSNVDLTREALARGASPNALCHFGSSPVDFAASSGPAEVCVQHPGKSVPSPSTVTVLDLSRLAVPGSALLRPAVPSFTFSEILSSVVVCVGRFFGCCWTRVVA